MEEIEINSVAELVEAIKSKYDEGQTVWYRGQASSAWMLQPSIARGRSDNTVDLEIALIKKFKQNAVALITTFPSEEYEWLFIMQHNRLPTRLLDWSESSLVGLYFAVEDVSSEDNGSLWCLDPAKLNENASIRPSIGADIPSFSDDEHLRSYLPSAVASERVSRLPPIACIGPRNSSRMYAQQGVFTITHHEATSICSVADGTHLMKLVIPATKKPEIRKELAILGITKLSLFPDLENVAQLAKEAF